MVVVVVSSCVLVVVAVVVVVACCKSGGCGSSGGSNQRCGVVGIDPPSRACAQEAWRTTTIKGAFARHLHQRLSPSTLA